MNVYAKPTILLAALAGLAAAPQAYGQWDSILTWNNAVGGTASVAGNWNPSVAPAGTDDLVFNLVASYPVTFSAATPSSNSQTYKKGNVTVNVTSPHTVANGVRIGETIGDNAIVTLGSGTLTSNTSTTGIGFNQSTGILNLNSSTAVFNAQLTAFIGETGNATLNLTNLSTFNCGASLVTAGQPSSIAAVTISGSSGALRSRLIQASPIAESRIGQQGNSTMSITNGGLAQFAGPVVVGHVSGSTSTVAVNTAGVFPSTLTTSSDLLIGRNNIAGFGAGNGALNVGLGGTANIGGTLFLGGDSLGGTGSLSITGAGTEVVCKSLDMGNGGSVSIAQGSLRVDSGTFSYSNTATDFTLGGGSGSQLVLDNGATASLAPTAGTRAMIIGGGAGSQNGAFRLDHGSVATVTSGQVVIGDNADDVGILSLANGGTLNCAPTSVMVIGASGNGGLLCGSGTEASLTAGQVQVGAAAGSSGGLTIQAAAFPVNATLQSLYVGGTSAAPGGNSTLFLTGSNATLNIAASGVSFKSWPGGAVTLTDSTLNVAGTMQVTGDYTWTNANVNANIASLLSSGSVSGTINGRVAIGNAVADVVTLNGDLTAGNAASASGFSNTGTINVGDNTLTILDQNAAVLNNCSVGPSGRVVAANGVTIGAGTTLSGGGIIEAGVTNAGQITSTGNGMTFFGIVNGVGTGINGVVTHYLHGGGFTGTGTIGTSINADGQAVFTATGPLTMGSAANSSGVLFNGTLHCGNNAVTLLDLNGVGLGLLTDIAGGSLTSANGLAVGIGRSIRGKGSIGVNGGTFTVLGTIDPDDFTAATQTFENLGTLNVAGNYTQTTTGRYQCDLAGFDSEFRPQRDLIQATGALSLAGSLDISFILGYVPAASDFFDVAIGASRTGTFGQVTSPPTSFGPAHVVYLADRARVVLCYANCDGSANSPQLNALDFTCFLNRFAAGEAYANCDNSTTAPVLNALDFTCYLNKFAAGCN